MSGRMLGGYRNLISGYMSSTKALAMDRVDQKEYYDINNFVTSKRVLPHLLAEPEVPQESNIDHDCSTEVDTIHNANLSLEVGMEWVKIKIRQWAKAVASNNDKNADLRLKEIALLMDHHIMAAKSFT
ncbi:Rab escort protein 1 [Senna tora]|uniref:Rab escort protein 1 n=1 Tax=Senna tora TaxID=362788 RepID=A0A834WY73_9FABA|nr:Rab escort protein 1 [Senna tora]